MNKKLFYSFIVLGFLLFSIPLNAVTFNVTVPAGTQKCYVAGAWHGWAAGSALELEKNGTNSFTLTLPDVTQAQVEAGYKYLAGRDWTYVEKNADGSELSNRISMGNPDVVAKWAAVPVQTNVITEKLNFNFPDGITSHIAEILLPKDYEANPTKQYPVLYVHGIQQFYRNSGNDGDAKENFFSPNSWGAEQALESLQNGGTQTGIVVRIYGLLPELSPWNNPVFMGTGKADQYLDIFISQVIPYLKSKYRISNDPKDNSLLGFDMGGLFAFYAALKHQDKFSSVALFSPSFWFNKNELSNYVDNWTKTNEDLKFYFTVGEREGDMYQLEVANMVSKLATKGVDNAKISFDLIANGQHNDSFWKTKFSQAYLFSLGLNNTSSLVKNIDFQNLSANLSMKSPQFSAEYRFMGGETTSSVACDVNGVLSLVNYHQSSGAIKQAKTYIKIVPASMKAKYYFNVNKSSDCTGSKLFASDKDVSFSSSKQFDSWIRVVVFEDETSENVAASSNFFRLIKGDNKETLMTPSKSDGSAGSDDNFAVSATVDFKDAERTFQIYFGSVNSGAKMSALTRMFEVSATCSKAQIIYLFKTNEVIVTELEHKYNPNEPETEPAITAFTAIPSVGKAGVPVVITATPRNLEGYNVTFKLARNYETATNQTATLNSNGDYTFTFTPSQGIYEITISATKSGASTVTNSVWVKVPYTEIYQTINKGVVTNAYSEVNWETTGRYKANYHTHSDQSFDTSINPNDVVDRYQSKAYQILALTEHDANSYPWEMFQSFNYAYENRNSGTMGMLTFPAVELSKDSRNNWSETTGGEFNHHNDFFTGRKGQEFISLQESYAYTEKLGGLQIINHPGQYWSIDKTYDNDNFQKDSPAWHVRNFQTYPSLIGLEVYNQGNRRPNDRILWDQILDKIMPERPVYGYSCDDAHTLDHYFRNYQFMLMDELSIPALKDAMHQGKLYFSYEPGGSGAARAPRIQNIQVDNDAKTITVEADSEEIYWISGTDIKDGVANTRKSTVVGYGKTFYFDGFQGNYIRALIKNQYGETCTQPFGFGEKVQTNYTVTVSPAAQGAVTVLNKGNVVNSGDQLPANTELSVIALGNNSHVFSGVNTTPHFILTQNTTVSASFAPVEAQEKYIIGAYNIRYYNTGDTDGKAWDNRKQLVFNLINKYNYDACGIQEITNTQAADFVSSLSGYTYVGYGRDNGKEYADGGAGEQTGLIYRTNRFNELARGRFFLSNTPDALSKLPNSTFNRMVAWVKLEDKTNQNVFFLLSTHFDHPTTQTGINTRHEQAQIAKTQILALTGGYPVIFTGDFNCEPSEPAYSVLSAEWSDAFETTPTPPQGGYLNGEHTYTGLYSATDVTPKRIDYIFVNDKVNIKSYIAADEKLAHSTYPSDHLPVLVELLFDKTSDVWTPETQMGLNVKIIQGRNSLQISNRSDEAVSFRLYDQAGRMLADASIKDDYLIRSIETGIYIAWIEQNGTRYAKKVIVY